MKTKQAHTKGPWIVEDVEEYNNEGYKYTERVLFGQKQIIHAIGKPWVKERIAIIESDKRADEALLTSAPELLNACENLLFALRERHEESMIEEDGSMEQHKINEPDCDYCRRIKEAEIAIAKAEGK